LDDISPEAQARSKTGQPSTIIMMHSGKRKTMMPTTSIQLRVRWLNLDEMKSMRTWALRRKA